MTQISAEGSFRAEYFNTVFESSSPIHEFPAEFAIVTAYNPNGKLCACEENQRRDQRLRELLQSRGIRYWRVTGCAPDGSHEEPGYGIHPPMDVAVELGRQFQQEAIFWISNGELTLVSCGDLKTMSLGSFAARLRGEIASSDKPNIGYDV